MLNTSYSGINELDYVPDPYASRIERYIDKYLNEGGSSEDKDQGPSN